MAIVRARIDDQVKDDAMIALGEMGLSMSDAIRMLLTRVAKEHKMPFDLKVPNSVTVQAMIDANNDNMETVESIDDLFAGLDDEDD